MDNVTRIDDALQMNDLLQAGGFPQANGSNQLDDFLQTNDFRQTNDLTQTNGFRQIEFPQGNGFQETHSFLQGRSLFEQTHGLLQASGMNQTHMNDLAQIDDFNTPDLCAQDDDDACLSGLFDPSEAFSTTDTHNFMFTLDDDPSAGPSMIDAVPAQDEDVAVSSNDVGLTEMAFNEPDPSTTQGIAHNQGQVIGLFGHNQRSETPITLRMTPRPKPSLFTGPLHPLQPPANHSTQKTARESCKRPDRTKKQKSLMGSLGIESKEGEGSERSWEDCDLGETWVTCELRTEIQQLLRNDEHMTMMTNWLSRADRKHVHSMCHLLGLSRTNYYDGRPGSEFQRVLIAKCAVLTLFDSSVKIRTLSADDAWSGGTINPRLVVVRNLGANLARRKIEIMAKLTEAKLPLPQDVQVSAQGDLFLIFDSVFDAMRSYVAIETPISGWPTVTCDYLRFVDGPQYRLHVAFSINSSSAAGSAHGHFSSAGSTGRSAHSSAGSATSWVSSEYGDLGGRSKKRKRQSKIIGGYSCAAQDCSMVFDRDCDLRKHEKVHSDHRPHICLKCGKGFQWPKDLRRHGRRHHGDEVNVPKLDAIDLRGPQMDFSVRATDVCSQRVEEWLAGVVESEPPSFDPMDDLALAEYGPQVAADLDLDS
ncbi:hypothetical protein M409DRAFT_18938 [Zasmidium cellare ATCC 36951]|uniref:C2H2-type domain-containing protein n=1 Tax=Zasmidium cellare ATCC 36951 TaxID=1080233 RepID=A0A6A6CXL5_ZASCE|nr:uncharacterized protein M409DRAFT_18938 [Zasmidium cellare ATCC 36951]KAF2170968.1 hypothetical protein M409DRAFT_18938 [Zasmidium cellare ATCC 36951]